MCTIFYFKNEPMKQYAEQNVNICISKLHSFLVLWNMRRKGKNLSRIIYLNFKIIPYDEQWDLFRAFPKAGAESFAHMLRILHDMFKVTFTVNMCSLEIPGSHGGEYEDDSLLGYSAVYSRWSKPTFRRCVLPPSSGRWGSWREPRRLSS
jgi:hypothetical protein